MKPMTITLGLLLLLVELAFCLLLTENLPIFHPDENSKPVVAQGPGKPPKPGPSHKPDWLHKRGGLHKPGVHHQPAVPAQGNPIVYTYWSGVFVNDTTLLNVTHNSSVNRISSVKSQIVVPEVSCPDGSPRGLPCGVVFDIGIFNEHIMRAGVVGHFVNGSASYKAMSFAANLSELGEPNKYDLDIEAGNSVQVEISYDSGKHNGPGSMVNFSIANMHKGAYVNETLPLMQPNSTWSKSIFAGNEAAFLVEALDGWHMANWSSMNFAQCSITVDGNAIIGVGNGYRMLNQDITSNVQLIGNEEIFVQYLSPAPTPDNSTRMSSTSFDSSILTQTKW